MNEQLQAKLIEILSAIQSTAKATGDFALEQLPDIAQQYVLYGRASLTTAVVAAAIGLLAAWVAAFRYRRNVAGDGFFAAAIASLPLGAVILFNISEMFLVWFAPKVWLIKELAGLIK